MLIQTYEGKTITEWALKVKDLQAENQRLTEEREEARDWINRPMCLVCSKQEPCELSKDEQSPCTFDPTPKQLFEHNKHLRQRLATLTAALKKIAEYAYSPEDRLAAIQDVLREVMPQALKALPDAGPAVKGVQS